MSNNWKGGSTRRWRKIRRAILNANLLDNAGRCTLQIPGICTGRATCVHHTHGKATTGDDPRYLTAACTECNLHVGDPSKHDPQPRPMTRW